MQAANNWGKNFNFPVFDFRSLEMNDSSTRNLHVSLALLMLKKIVVSSGEDGHRVSSQIYFGITGSSWLEIQFSSAISNRIRFIAIFITYRKVSANRMSKFSTFNGWKIWALMWHTSAWKFVYFLPWSTRKENINRIFINNLLRYIIVHP